MRIVGGQFSGRRFSPPANIPARPTTDLAKEGLFNILCNLIDFEGIETLELFGGTGNITYELASRGAAQMTIVERDLTSIDFIKKTVQNLDLSSRINIVRGDAFKFMKQCDTRYDFIFADPPYALNNMDQVPLMVFELNLLKPDGLFVLEHTTTNNYQQHPDFLRIKNYGTTNFSFFTQQSQ